MKDKNILYENDEGTKTRIPCYTSFVEQRKDIDRSSALYSIKVSFELVHADVADIRFFSRSAVHPKYCLLAVDLFTSNLFVYAIKNRSFLAKKLELFLSRYSSKKRLDHQKLKDEISNGFGICTKRDQEIQ